MAPIPHIATRPGFSQASVDHYYAVGAGGHGDRNGTESVVQVKWGRAGTVTTFYIHISANDLNNTSTFRLRVNGTNSALSITVPATTTGHFTATGSVAIAAGDLLSISFTTLGAGAGVVVDGNGLLFEADTDTVARLTGIEHTSIVNGQELHLAGKSVDVLTEAHTQDLIRTDATIERPSFHISSNTRDGATTIRFRKNGNNGSQVVTIGAGVTGWIEDLVNSDDVVSGDLCNWQVTLAGTTGSIFLEAYACDFVTTNDQAMLYGAHNNNPLASALTRYFPLMGSGEVYQVLEAPTQHRALDANDVSHLHVYVISNTINGSSVFTLRVNGAPGSQSITIPALTSGWFEDTVNTETVADTDLLNLELVTGGTLGQILLSTWGVLWGAAPGADPVVQTRAATGIQFDRATLRGRVDPNGVLLDGYFQWGLDPGTLSNDTSPDSVGSGTVWVSMLEVITGLTRNTTYYFRAVATEGGSPEFFGEILSFTTLDEHLFVDGDVSHPLTMISFIDRLEERHVFAEVDLNDPSDYEGGYKAPKVLNWLPITRGFSDRTGQLEHMVFGALLSDTDRFFRELLDDPTNRFLTNRPLWEKMIDDEDRRREQLWRYVANGYVSDYEPRSPLQIQLTGCDWLKKKFSRKARAQSAWQPMITVDVFPECKEFNLNKAAPIVYGRMDDTRIEETEIGTTADYDGTIRAVSTAIVHDEPAGPFYGPVTVLVVPVVSGDEGPISNAAGSVASERDVAVYWDHQGTADSYNVYFHDGGWLDWTPHQGVRDGAEVTFVRKLTHDNSTIDGNDKSRDFKVLLTSLTDGSDALTGVMTALVDKGHGTHKLLYVGTVEPFTGGPVYAFLVARGAVHSIRELYVDGIAQNIATDAGQSGIGGIWYIPGYANWNNELPDPYIEIGGNRYTVIYGKVGYPGPDKGAGLTVPEFVPGTRPANVAVGVTVNVWGYEDVGDGTGEPITSLPQQMKHFVRNFLAGNEPPGTDWRVTCPTFEHEPTLTVVDEDTFDAVEAIWEEVNTDSPAGIEGAFVIGANGVHETALDVLAKFNVSGDWNSTFSRKGQFMLSMEPASVPDDLVEIDDVVNITADSFQIRDMVSSEFFNILPYVHTEDYTGITESGWHSVEDGERDVRDATSITNYDQERESPQFQLHMLRSNITGSTVIDLVMARKLARYRHPLRTAACTVPLSGTGIEVGQLFRFTHTEGIGASGWEGRIVRTTRHELDPNMNRTRLEVYDVEPLLT